MPGPTVSGADWADGATARAWATTVGQHLDALAAAGLTDVDMPWRAFWSVLILAKKPILEEGRTR